MVVSARLSRETSEGSSRSSALPASTASSDRREELGLRGFRGGGVGALPVTVVGDSDPPGGGVTA